MKPRSGTADIAHAAAAPGLPQLQFVQIAFAGHNRSEDLGDPDHVSNGLTEAFSALASAGVRNARLICGLAPGADLLAVKAWRAAGLGPIHAVLPFLDEEVGEGLAESATWLDGAATAAVGRNPHLAQTRWLIGAADLLVVVWTGETARGAGGTGDAVRLALEHGLPVLWVKPGEPDSIRLIQPEHLDEDFGFLEFLEELRFGREPLVRTGTPGNISRALCDLGLAAPAPELAQAMESDADGRPLARTPAIWRTYAVFRRFVGGTAPAFEAKPPPADLAADPGFQELSRAQAIADARASRLGAMHRSHQVLLLGVAIFAAIAGSVSAMWPQVKLAMVWLELMLAIGALLVWLDSERGHHHEHWGEARKLAEDLRLERVAWAFGVSTVSHRMNSSASRAARYARRNAGLPQGVFAPDRIASWGAWAVDELIWGQAAYHAAQSKINTRISHRVHLVENSSFAVLLVIMVAYITTALGLAPFGLDAPHWLGGLVVMAGAIVPAIGAAGLALEATLSLGEQGQRSLVLASRLSAVGADLGDAPGLEALQSAAKAAIRLQRAQEEHWTEGAVRRRLFRGG